MFAGKQIHPFFSLWKVGTRHHETNEAESSCCLVQRKYKSTTIGPIHVFEKDQVHIINLAKQYAYNLKWLSSQFVASMVLNVSTFILLFNSAMVKLEFCYAG